MGPPTLKLQTLMLWPPGNPVSYSEFRDRNLKSWAPPRLTGTLISSLG